MNLLTTMENFSEMKINLLNFVKEHAEEWDLTNKQITILTYILKGKNFLKSKSEIAKNCNVSRPTVGKLYDLLETMYDEYEKY